MAAPIGLDIGSSAVRAAQIRQGRLGSVLERVGAVDLPSGSVRNGEIVQPGVVIDAIKELWKSARLKGRKVSVGLANQQVVVRRLDLPWMPESELRASLPLQVDGMIPIPVDEAVLDFCYLGERESEDGQRVVRILVIAALRTMVDEILAVVRQAKLDPVGIDLDAFAALRAMAPPDVLADDTAELLVDVGSTVTDLVVHQNGSPHFVRTVLFGGQNVTRALAQALDLEHDEAEAVKLELAEVGAVAPVDDRAVVAIDGQTRQLIDEVRSSIDYCTAQRDIPAIARIVLTGGASQWPGLADEMAEQLGMDIATGSPLHALDNSSGVSDDDLAAAAPHLAVAVGLALGAQS
jgi:type IV pilus assembly protein PilM